MPEAHGWIAPDAESFPTGRDLADRYLEPVAGLPELAPRIRLGTRVTAVGRAGLGKVRDAGRDAAPFETRFEDAGGREGRLLAGAVIDASGTWGNHGRAGASGLSAIGEYAAADRIRYRIPDVLGAERARYAGRRTMVLGSGGSGPRYPYQPGAPCRPGARDHHRLGGADQGLDGGPASRARRPGNAGAGSGRTRSARHREAVRRG